MNNYIVRSIGKTAADEEGFRVVIDPEYRDAMIGLDGFSYIQVVWFFDKCDNELSRSRLIEEKPYKKGPEKLGTFATRSPQRPNPIAVSTAYVTYIDRENGVIGLAYLDADNDSPVLDIKPYTPSLDRVGSPNVPDWCTNWPKDVESSGDFDWSEEFNF